MRYLLFFPDGQEGSRPFDWAWIDKWCSMYGVYPVMVDKTGSRKTTDHSPFYFHSLSQAVSHPSLKDLSWVWLDTDAEKYIDEISLPREDVVFCVGDDMDGFCGFEIKGQRVKIRSKHPDGEDEEMFAAVCVPLLFFEVFDR